ncbi:tRNA-dihydrouridine synthase family protein, partial [Myxococcota bacterium]|nr:tRNA-dihydrouridine synthase family protein [Myxococcota bacterium]
NDLIPANNSLPVIPQIIGKNHVYFLELAMRFLDLGHERINWNLGCPFPTMTKKGCGSALLPHPDLVDDFLEKVLGTFPGKLSVKVRLGLTDSGDLSALIPVFNRYPLDEIIIHPRTGKQMYKGRLDLDRFQEALVSLDHPVVYNGEITTPEEFHEVQERFPSVNRFMLGRGLFANPLLASEIKSGKSISDLKRYELIFAFHEELFFHYTRRLSGSAHLYHKMAGHWEYLHRTLPGGAKMFKRLRRMQSFHDYVPLIAALKKSLLSG